MYCSACTCIAPPPTDQNSHGVDEFQHVFILDVLQPQSLELLPLTAQQSLTRLQVSLQRSDLLLRLWGEREGVRREEGKREGRREGGGGGR